MAAFESVRDVLLDVWDSVGKALKISVAAQAGMTFLGEQTITQTGATIACTIPATANLVEISAEGAAVRYTINSSATLNSGGYVPDGQTRYVIHVANLTSLEVFGAVPGKAHINYYREP